MARPTSAGPMTIEQLLAAKAVVVTCGSGGVGRTTTAAAVRPIKSALCEP